MSRRNPHTGLVVLWVKLRQRGYQIHYTIIPLTKKAGLTARKTFLTTKYVPKPYEQMLYPGQRIQIDVKFVPSVMSDGEAKGKRFYQYTAIDEFSRWRYVEAFEEHSTYSSMKFLVHLVRLSRCL